MDSVEANPRAHRDHIRKAIKAGVPPKGEILEKYGVYDSDILDYQLCFNSVLVNEAGTIFLPSWLQEKEALTIIDLFSSTEAIASVFRATPSTKPKFGLAVSMEDVRTNPRKKEDAELNIEKLDGNLMLPSTWKKIRKKLEGRRADLIIERGVMGIDDFSLGLEFYEVEFAVGKMWEMLNKNGMMLLQVSYRLDKNSVSQWAEFLVRNGVDVIYDEAGLVRIDKTADSPEKLPFLGQ